MKKTVLLLLVAGLFAATPVLAVGKDSGQQTAGEHVQRCVLQSEAIGQKIERLQSEIKKGDKKYSAEELRKLEEKLNEANAMLDSIAKP
jgi:Skp family chaperone for outer membrane proteins